MDRVSRGVSRSLNAFLDTLTSARASGHQVVCIQCHGRVSSESYLTTHAKGFKLDFCSRKCGHSYWYEYGQHQKTPPAVPQGPRTCRLPGCNKPCFVEGTRVHDYCGRSHAQQANAVAAGAVAGPQTYGSHSCHSVYGPIYFYNRGEPYYEFTNFYEIMVCIDGQDWLTTEHYFQAQKFVGTPLVRTIRLMERPRDAFDKSRDPRYTHWRRSDWEEMKEDIMFKALQAKFTQHEKLKRMLVGTKDRQLVERSPHDSYWGDGGDGSGKNRLGALLMRLRDDLTPKPETSHQSNTHTWPPSPPGVVHSHRTTSPSSQHQPLPKFDWSTKPHSSQSLPRQDMGNQHKSREAELQSQSAFQQNPAHYKAQPRDYPPPTYQQHLSSADFSGNPNLPPTSELVVPGAVVRPIPQPTANTSQISVASKIPPGFHNNPPNQQLASIPTGNLIDL